MRPQLTLVLGGAASGKSAFAEHLVCSAGKTPFYIATAQALDAEMAGKITTHQARRGIEWSMREAPLDLVGALMDIPTNHIVLVDCATMWLANQLEQNCTLAKAENALLHALANCASPVVMVSNELGQGIVPENALARQFRQSHGALNQRLAAQAEVVVSVIAGLSMIMKGALPVEIQ